MKCMNEISTECFNAHFIKREHDRNTVFPLSFISLPVYCRVCRNVVHKFIKHAYLHNCFSVEMNKSLRQQWHGCVNSVLSILARMSIRKGESNYCDPCTC